MAAAVRWLSLLVCLAASSPLIGQFAARWPNQIVIFGKQSESLAAAEQASLTIIQLPVVLLDTLRTRFVCGGHMD